LCRRLAEYDLIVRITPLFLPQCSITDTKDRPGSSDEDTELAAALRRESRLKEKLHDLVTTLDKVSRNSEERHSQSAELVNDLKRANG